jgi:hypothetical protein
MTIYPRWKKTTPRKTILFVGSMPSVLKINTSLCLGSQQSKRTNKEFRSDKLVPQIVSKKPKAFFSIQHTIKTSYLQSRVSITFNPDKI